MLTLNHFDIEAQYQRLGDKVKLVILHPAAYSSHRIISQLLLEEKRALYVHLPSEAKNLHAAVAPIFDAISRQLGIQDANVPSKKADVAPTLAQLLNQAKGVQCLFEGYDGEVAALLNPVVVDVVKALNSGTRIVLSGRSLATDVINPLLDDHSVAVLPIDPQRLLIDYTQPETGKNFLEVRAFGNGQVLVNGRPIDKWEGLLPRALFFFFIDQAMTTRDQIFGTFWPTLTTREATNVFHVTKRKISEILRLHMTVYGSGFYRVAPDIDLHYDVVNFQEAVQNAAVAPDNEAEKLYQVAIDLYHDDFLSGMEGDWVEKRRDEMRQTYTDALVGLGRIYDSRGEKEAALGLFLRASASSPRREDLVRSIMELYSALGQPQTAIETYTRLVQLLDNELGVGPDRQTTELADSIRSVAF